MINLKPRCVWEQHIYKNDVMFCVLSNVAIQNKYVNLNLETLCVMLNAKP